MSTIIASYMSLNFNGNNSSSASGSMSPSAADATFSDTLSMTEMSLSPTAGGQASGFEAILSLTDQATPANTAAADGSFSQIFALLQEMVSDMENAQGGANQGSTQTVVPAASSSASSDGLSIGALQLAQEGGPLPAFLNAMDSQGNLSPAQQQSLWNIAAENMNAPGDQQTIQTIAAELQQAGISETIPSSIAV